MTAPTYAELVRELFPRLTGGIRWGLERTARMLAAAGDPHHRYATIHVGGTNGKGSVAATIARVLTEAGHRTGLYSSPHLTTFRERIRIDDAPIPEAALVAAAVPLWTQVRAERPSFFEATTAIALLALAQAEVEVAVIEVGLGGRLDATNVIAPVLSVLTNVSLDHVQLLGDTVVDVAAEKAGILKAGVPALTGESDPDVLAVFQRRAQSVGTTLTVLPADAPADVTTDVDGTRFRLTAGAWGEIALRTPLLGRHQARNTALAATGLAMLPPALRPGRDALLRGVATVHWPGRAQRVRHAGATWLFDVAHNAAGVAALVETVRSLALPRPVAVLLGVLGDKDWRSMVGPLATAADSVTLTLPPTAPPERRWDPHAVLREVAAPNARVVEDFGAALTDAWRAARGGTVVVTGSFHTVGDALIALDLAPWGADTALPHPSFAL